MPKFLPSYLRATFFSPNHLTFIIFLYFLSPVTPSQAQLNNTPFYVIFPVDSTRKNTLSVEFSTLGFLKNNEFDNMIIKGYTLFGYQLNPRLRYQFSQNLLLEGGVFLRKDFGAEGFFQIEPTFTLKYQKNGFAVIFGNLEGALAHKLIEPLFDFENVIDQKLENGIQFKVDKERWELDTWLDWRKAIYQDSPFQEEFSAGLQASFDVWSTASVRLKASLQTTVYHLGGQIDTTAAPVITAVNYAPGLILDIGNLEHSALPTIRFEGYFTGHSNAGSTPELAFENGNGWYANITYFAPFVDVMMSYWQGNDYVSIIGGDLFSSQSRIARRNNEVVPERQLLFLRLMKDITLARGTQLSIRLQPYYDFQTNVVEHYMGLYFNSNFSFALWNKK